MIEILFVCSHLRGISLGCVLLRLLYTHRERGSETTSRQEPQVLTSERLVKNLQPTAGQKPVGVTCLRLFESYGKSALSKLIAALSLRKNP